MAEHRTSKKGLTDEQKDYILENYGVMPFKDILKNINSYSIKVKRFLATQGVDENGKLYDDGYDKRYKFARKKGFRFVSDALDKYGFKKFEELYQNSLK